MEYENLICKTINNIDLRKILLCSFIALLCSCNNGVKLKTDKLPDTWLGKFSVAVTVEETAIITYNFSITNESVDLETNTYHAPIRCNGKYSARLDDNILVLNYIGNEKYCETEKFEIKIEKSEYYIKGVGGEEIVNNWIKLNRQ